MIIVIGSPIGRLGDGVIEAAGMAARVALAAAAIGRTVQLVGKTGDDPTADAVVLDLARGHVGHAALLRDPARATRLEAPPTDTPDDDAEAFVAGDEPPPAGISASEPVMATPLGDGRSGPALEAADVELGLRYLTEFAVVVVAEPVEPTIVAIVADAARWGEARMILVVGAGERAPADLPADVVVFEAPDADPGGAFATLVGSFAAALDGGADPADAFAASIASDGWTGTAGD
ncbi:MAG: hypothetical protein ABI553_02620 [Chloroflexota bacterium]